MGFKTSPPCQPCAISQLKSQWELLQLEPHHGRGASTLRTTLHRPGSVDVLRGR